MFSILTALFDEYEILRLYKKAVTLGFSGILALASALYCTKNGLDFTELLFELNISSQAIMNLLLLIIIVWVYGRERLQRDVAFMTNNDVLQTWKIYTVRFVTPIFLVIIFALGVVCFNERKNDYFDDPGIFNLGVLLTTLSLSALPVYGVLKLMQTRGSFAMKFKRCVKPKNWYPTYSEDRQRYEETIDNPETIQPLTTI